MKQIEKFKAPARITQEMLACRLGTRKTQAQLAKEMGVTQSQVSKIEAGLDRDLTLGQFHQWARATAWGPEIALVLDVRTGFWKVGGSPDRGYHFVYDGKTKKWSQTP